MSVRNPLIEWEVLRVAREMIELDARTRTVAEVTGLSTTKARAMYRAKHGRAQKAGNMIILAKSFVSTPTRALHTSLICGIHRWLAEFRGKRDADTLLGTYRLYERLCRSQGVEPPFDINGVYQIIRLLNGGRLVTTRCQRCRCDFTRDPDEDWFRPGRSGSRLCPACEILTSSAAGHDGLSRAVTSRRHGSCTGDRRPPTHSSLPPRCLPSSHAG